MFKQTLRQSRNSFNKYTFLKKAFLIFFYQFLNKWCCKTWTKCLPVKENSITSVGAGHGYASTLKQSDKRVWTGIEVKNLRRIYRLYALASKQSFRDSKDLVRYDKNTDKQSNKGLFLRGMPIHTLKINRNLAVNGYLIGIGCIDSSLCRKQSIHLHLRGLWHDEFHMNLMSQARSALDIQSVIQFVQLLAAKTQTS